MVSSRITRKTRGAEHQRVNLSGTQALIVGDLCPSASGDGARRSYLLGLSRRESPVQCQRDN